MAKAQVTAFIIIGLVIVATLGIGLYYLNSLEPEIDSSPEKAVAAFIDKCIQDSAEPGLAILGMQGGYIDLPPIYLASNRTRTAYGIYRNNLTLASRAIMEQQLADFTSQSLLQCVNNFSAFPSLSIVYQKPEVTAAISEENAVLKIDFPVTVKNTRLQSFIHTAPSRLGHMHTIAGQIIAKQLKDVDWIDLSSMSAYDSKVRVVPIEDDTMLVSISDEDTVFMFAERLVLNQQPHLELPATFELQDSVRFSYNVSCTDPDRDAVSINDDSAMFDASSGSISFTPEVPGEYTVRLTCTDAKGNYDQKKTIIKVSE